MASRAPAGKLSGSPTPQKMEYAPLLAAPDVEFEAISEREFDKTLDLDGEERHDPLLHNAGVDAEQFPDLEFDQTVGW